MTNKTLAVVVLVLLGCDHAAEIGETSQALRGPRTLRATTVSSSAIDLSWGQSDGELGLLIERTDPSDGSYRVIDTAPMGASSYRDENLLPQTTYSYRVRAYAASGVSTYTNGASATTLALPITAPTTHTWSAPSPVPAVTIQNPPLDCRYHADTRVIGAEGPLTSGSTVTVEFCLTPAELEGAISLELVAKWSTGLNYEKDWLTMTQEYQSAVFDGTLGAVLEGWRASRPETGMKPYKIDTSHLQNGYGTITVTLPRGITGTVRFDLNREWKEYTCCRNSFMWLQSLERAPYPLRSNYRFALGNLVFVTRELGLDKIVSNMTTGIAQYTAGIIAMNQPGSVGGALFWLVDFQQLGTAWVPADSLLRAAHYTLRNLRFESDGSAKAGGRSSATVTLVSDGDVTTNPVFPNLALPAWAKTDKMKISFTGADALMVPVPTIEAGFQRELSVSHTRPTDVTIGEGGSLFFASGPDQISAHATGGVRLSEPYVDPDSNPWTDPWAGYDGDTLWATENGFSIGTAASVSVTNNCGLPLSLFNSEYQQYVRGACQ